MLPFAKSVHVSTRNCLKGPPASNCSCNLGRSFILSGGRSVNRRNDRFRRNQVVLVGAAYAVCPPNRSLEYAHQAAWDLESFASFVEELGKEVTSCVPVTRQVEWQVSLAATEYDARLDPAAPSIRVLDCGVLRDQDIVRIPNAQDLHA
jgi:hypothetical protein